MSAPCCYWHTLIARLEDLAEFVHQPRDFIGPLPQSPPIDCADLPTHASTETETERRDLAEAGDFLGFFLTLSGVANPDGAEGLGDCLREWRNVREALGLSPWKFSMTFGPPA